ncbi:neuronal calcium sensor 1-like [Clavelina lepadiformis]|uniref:neuronal calcium sensor 1-like n=1 Tax=Clavelina lepadiformis TaxID=159417 RepID=UPI004040F1F0
MGQKESQLPDEEVARLSTETHFTPEEISQWYKGFIRDCPSGRFTIAEFQQIAQSFFPNGNAENFSRFVFNAVDVGPDASLGFEGFIKFLSLASRGTVEDKERWAFHLRDVDHSGFITKENLRLIDDATFSMIADHVPLPNDEDTAEKRSEKVFNLMDTDKNGRVDVNEFIAACNKDEDIVKALSLQDTVQ